MITIKTGELSVKKRIKAKAKSNSYIMPIKRTVLPHKHAIVVTSAARANPVGTTKKKRSVVRPKKVSAQTKILKSSGAPLSRVLISTKRLAARKNRLHSRFKRTLQYYRIKRTSGAPQRDEEQANPS